MSNCGLLSSVAPQTQRRPPRARLRMLSGHVAPSESTTRSTPRPPVCSRTHAENGVVWSTAAAAPSASAFARFSGVLAPANTRAPPRSAMSIAAAPTPPPAARTSTSSPGRTSPRVTTHRHAVQYEVDPAAAVVKSTPGGIGSRLAAGTATYSAKPPCVCSPKIRYSGHIVCSPRAQYSQRPHDSGPKTTTRLPGRTPAVPDPTASTSPAMSAPVMTGYSRSFHGNTGCGGPVRAQTSIRFIAQARTRTSASPACKSGTGTRSTETTSGPPRPWTTAAFIVRTASALLGREAVPAAAPLQNQADTLQAGDVFQRIAVDADDVGRLAGLERAALVAEADRLRGALGGGAQRVVRIGPPLHDLRDLPPDEPVHGVGAEGPPHAALEDRGEVFAGLLARLHQLGHDRRDMRVAFLDAVRMARDGVVGDEPGPAVAHLHEVVHLAQLAVLDRVHAGLDADPDSGPAVRVDGHRLVVPVRLLDRHLHLVPGVGVPARRRALARNAAGHEQLDQIGPRGDVLADVLADLVLSVRVRERGAVAVAGRDRPRRHDEARSRQPAGGDRLAQLDVDEMLLADDAHRRHAGEQIRAQIADRAHHLRRRRLLQLPDLVAESRVDGRVGVRVDEGRQHRLRSAIDDLRAGGNGRIGLAPHRRDPVPVDEHHAALDRRASGTVEHPLSFDRQEHTAHPRLISARPTPARAPAARCRRSPSRCRRRSSRA